MYLHKYKDLFEQAVSAASGYFKIDPSIVEKDYYITIFLKQLSQRLPTLLFKGGTSLSKCYKIINRFSEDLDITLIQDPITQGQRKKVKQAIKDICAELNMVLLNESETKSRRDFNRYEIDYSSNQPAAAIKPILLVETTYIVKAYPYETRPVSSMIYDYMAFIGQENFAAEYELTPFPVYAQSMERTLIDKVFAICDYYLTNNIPEHSRHIYDISRLIGDVDLNDDFVSLFQTVRKDRQSGNDQCVSADDSYSITELLTEILEKDIYKRDYTDITSKLLFEPVTYNEAIKGLLTLIDSGLLG